MAEIAIIGSGPAGLMAAWRAAELGHEVKVFESAPTVGGMSGSFEIAGLRVDYGSHRLHPSTPPHGSQFSQPGPSLPYHSHPVLLVHSDSE